MITVRQAANRIEERDARYVRRRVFVDEQGVPPKVALDITHEVFCDHFVAITDTGEIIGTASGYNCYGLVLYKVERVAVLPEWRGRGIGHQLMQYIEDTAHRGGFIKTYLNAQIRSIRLYLARNYAPIGTPFIESGIVHIGMQKRLRT